MPGRIVQKYQVFFYCSICQLRFCRVQYFNAISFNKCPKCSLPAYSYDTQWVYINILTAHFKRILTIALKMLFISSFQTEAWDFRLNKHRFTESAPIGHRTRFFFGFTEFCGYSKMDSHRVFGLFRINSNTKP